MPSTMYYIFPPHILEFMRQEVESGAYGSEEELVVEAVSVLREMKVAQAELRADLKRSIADSDAGRVLDLDTERTLLEGRKRMGISPKES